MNTLFVLIISLIALIYGAEKFIDFCEAFARKLKISEFTVGLTVVALGTSAPEIFVGLASVIDGGEDVLTSGYSLATGTVIGSNIANIALIFGIACAFRKKIPSRDTAKRQYIPVTFTALALGYVLFDSKIDLIDSIILFAGLPIFLLVLFKDKTAQASLANETSVVENKIPLIENIFFNIKFLPSSLINLSSHKISHILIGFFFSLVLILLGAEYVVSAAQNIAIELNVSTKNVGLVIVAIGTSLPELAATIAAIRRTKTDLVIGNVFGSNVMNISLVLPAMGFLNSSYSTSGFKVDSRFYESDWQIMLFFTVLLLLVVSFLNIVKDEFLLKFIKFFGAILLTLYFLYILKIANII